jgi:Raf kinase inhibitor-like YbhB/YbcL family protein
LKRLVLLFLAIFLVLATGGCEVPTASPGAVSATPTSTPVPPTATPAPPAPTSTPTSVPASPTPEPATLQPRLTLTSGAFEHGEEIPLRYAQRTFDTPEGWPVLCPGGNVSPPLSWSNVPAGAASLALTLYDHIALCEKCKDRAPEGRIWGHWGVYNIPATATSLPEGLSADPVLLDGSVQVVSGYNEIGYGGPCPPPGHTHVYVFTLYALDTTLNLPERATVDDLSAALEGHILGQAELMGTFLGR